MEKTVFPPDFLWGAATSPHQVEGETNNDWSEWEKKGFTKHLSGKACNHWNISQFQKDVELMKILGLNAYRMGIEWSRVMPEAGIIKYTVLEQYREMLTILKEAGIVTMVTLHHFTNPIWFARSGGWLRAPLEPFYNYIDATTKFLAENVDFWNTFNEPLVLIRNGYLFGHWPPGKKARILSAFYLRKKFAKVHNEVYKIVKRNTGRPVGIVHDFSSFETAHDRAIEQAIVGLIDRIINCWIIENTKNDFLGINFYRRFIFDICHPWRISEPKGLMSDSGWEINPASLTKILLKLKKYGLPIYITENGVADANDCLRADFIRDHIQAIKVAMKAGVDVRGYFYWSLLDNFEWTEGYTRRFGLIEVNFENQERKIRPSAFVYQDIIKETKTPTTSNPSKAPYEV